MIGILLAAFPGLYLGWGLGSNDAANVFGPPIGAGIIRYRRAVLLTAVFVMAGAMVEGRKCLGTVGELAEFSIGPAILAALSAGVVVHLLTWLRLPVSTSQAIVGAILGAAFMEGDHLPTDKLVKIGVCWVLTPIGAAVLAMGLYAALRWAWARRVKDLPTFHAAVRWGAILVGCYAAYNLGANNLANVTGVFVGAGSLSPLLATLIGGGSIALGVLTYSRRVIETVGKSIAPLDPMSGLVALLAEALILHLYTQIGVPVSSSQAIVGAVVGVGLSRGFRMVNRTMLLSILGGWLVTLCASAALAVLLHWLALPTLRILLMCASRTIGD